MWQHSYRCPLHQCRNPSETLLLIRVLHGLVCGYGSRGSSSHIRADAHVLLCSDQILDIGVSEIRDPVYRNLGVLVVSFACF